MIFQRRALLLSLLLSFPAVAPGAPAPASAPVLAEHVYRSATQGRNPTAMYELGNRFEQGMGVARDPEEAFRWYYRAAELGNGEAMNCLGIAYATGDGVPRNEELSMRWFLKAAENGSIVAMSNVAKSYYLGSASPML